MAPLFNNIAFSSTYATADSRSEYQQGQTKNFTLGLDYNIAANARAVRIPGWLDRAVAILPDWLLRTPALARQGRMLCVIRRVAQRGKRFVDAGEVGWLLVEPEPEHDQPGHSDFDRNASV